MADRIFKVGDVVMLKSGGPKMTVIKLMTGQLFLDCQFYNGDTFETKTFHEDTLKRA